MSSLFSTILSQSSGSEIIKCQTLTLNDGNTHQSNRRRRCNRRRGLQRSLRTTGFCRSMWRLGYQSTPGHNADDLDFDDVKEEVESGHLVVSILLGLPVETAQENHR